jgi:hypothetical protein
MKTIDRVMRAYLLTRNLTDAQVSQVRAELSRFKGLHRYGARSDQLDLRPTLKKARRVSRAF